MLLYRFFVLFISAAITQAEDVNFLLLTTDLPTDRNFMPTLANGHLGYTVFGDAIYMNGIYNGQGGDSRRARLPNWLNLTVDEINETKVENLKCKTWYEMHLRPGFFQRQQTCESLDLHLEQRSYPHRYYTRALVYELIVRRSAPARRILSIKLVQKPGNTSEAFDFTPRNFISHQNGTFKVLKGVTRTVEHQQFQHKKREVFIVFNEDFNTEKTLQMAAGEEDLYYRYIITADEEEHVAVQEMQAIMNETSSEMLRLHATQWKQFWQEFLTIKVENNTELSQIINAGMFYMASSLPSKTTHQPSRPYYGLSPTGLGRGVLDADYEGHNFWDTEIWMLPAVEQMSPDWGQTLLQYRLQHLSGAKYNAHATGYKGARFPWESAYTGTEVTNPCCPEVAAQEVHISADIAIALAAHYARNHERDWLCETAWPLAIEIAEYLTDRVEWNAQTQHYHVKMVMGPDEDHWNVTDNVYTNVAFKLALEFASFTVENCETSQKTTNYSKWLDVAQKLFILYDAELDYHPQHVGYQRGEEVKQADVILLGYPLQHTMNVSTRLNDLQAYENATRSSGPAMTWSMFAINYLDVNEVEKADYYFQKGYQDYVRPEFKVWSETKIGFSGSTNFLTGVGGFLQALINGYAGVRYEHEAGKSIMHIKRRRLPPETSAFTIEGIKFANAKFTLTIETQDAATLHCSAVGEDRLVLLDGSKRYGIFPGITVALTTNEISIETIDMHI